MPKLDPEQVPALRLTATADALEETLSREQRRELFEQPGAVVYAVVEMRSVSYTGHVNSLKDPKVAVEITLAEPARDPEQTQQLTRVMRAMYRRREMTGSLDELGPGRRDADQAVAEVLQTHPTESEFEEHRRVREARRQQPAP